MHPFIVCIWTELFPLLLPLAHHCSTGFNTVWALCYTVALVHLAVAGLVGGPCSSHYSPLPRPQSYGSFVSIIPDFVRINFRLAQKIQLLKIYIYFYFYF